MKPNYSEYLTDALSINPAEEALRDTLLPLLPDSIIDSHTHASHEKFINAFEMPPHLLSHMMSTFPDVNIEQSNEIDKLLMPGKSIQKLRFAHVYPGMDHKGVTEYINENRNEGDGTALFGLSETKEDIEYTINELRTGKYSALKMYYLSSKVPKTNLYDYFPREVLSVAETEEVPIILHLPHSLYNSQQEVDQLMNEYSDLKVILAHIGVANVPKPELDGILSSFAKHPNLYVDTAMVDSQEIALAALKHLTPKRVLYGSDEPLNLMRVVTYFNPDLNTDRVLTEYPYHWADKHEQDKWRHLADKPFVHSQWHQLNALTGAVRALKLSTKNENRALESIYYDNSKQIFNF